MDICFHFSRLGHWEQDGSDGIWCAHGVHGCMLSSRDTWTDCVRKILRTVSVGSGRKQGEDGELLPFYPRWQTLPFSSLSLVERV